MSRAILTSAVVALAKRRRGYSTVAAAAGKASEGLKKADAAASSASALPSPSAYSGSCSWVPDPVTGCYRPTNQSGGADAAAATRDSPLSKQQKTRG